MCCPYTLLVLKSNVGSYCTPSCKLSSSGGKATVLLCGTQPSGSGGRLIPSSLVQTSFYTDRVKFVKVVKVKFAFLGGPELENIHVVDRETSETKIYQSVVKHFVRQVCILAATNRKLRCQSRYNDSIPVQCDFEVIKNACKAFMA